MTKHDQDKKVPSHEEKTSSLRHKEMKRKDAVHPAAEAEKATMVDVVNGAASGKTTESPEELPVQESEIDVLKKQVDELNDRLLRNAAEFENFRKRMEREKQQFLSLANAALVSNILPVLDNFERALISSGDDAEHYRKGVEMIFKQLSDVLAGNGLEKIKAAGEHFNPELHEAMMSEPSFDHEEGEIIEVLQNGYTLKGRVLRPARVKVAAAPPENDISIDKEEA